ncbi:MAG: ABC transporter ATP-binding protein [Candidatus Kapabacteria bacterium]|jgi:lipoprotein-releasing system ATP-binding protein|nr:ABC transporter ATP-binding protein [Candidatus Kapabacteria bacterium]
MPTLLTAENLVKSYASGTSGEKTTVLHGVSLSIEQGEILAIVGSSGAGKSTLLHLLGALDEPDEGWITLTYHVGMQEGEPETMIRQEYRQLSDVGLSDLRNTMLGFIFQFHHLLPEFTALENVMMPALIAGKSHTEAREKAKELLSRVGLAHRLENKPDALSGGEQQRVAFARAMMNDPVLVLADEPTGNLDAANSALLLDLMKQFREESGITFAIVTHSSEIASGADRIIRLHEGQCV